MLLIFSLLAFTLPSLLFAGVEPTAGKLLIADRSLGDPNFSETVVLLMQYNQKGAMGIIINRASDISPSNLLPDMQELRSYKGKLYLGGPVAAYGLMVLIRAWDTPKGAENIFGDVHISGDSDLLRTLSKDGAGEAQMRVYAGYAGWSAGQLDNEIERGDWHLISATEDLVFSAEPNQIWQQLVPSGEAIIAALGIATVKR